MRELKIKSRIHVIVVSGQKEDDGKGRLNTDGRLLDFLMELKSNGLSQMKRWDTKHERAKRVKEKF